MCGFDSCYPCMFNRKSIQPYLFDNQIRLNSSPLLKTSRSLVPTEVAQVKSLWPFLRRRKQKYTFQRWEALYFKLHFKKSRRFRPLFFWKRGVVSPRLTFRTKWRLLGRSNTHLKKRWWGRVKRLLRNSLYNSNLPAATNAVRGGLKSWDPSVQKHGLSVKHSLYLPLWFRRRRANLVVRPRHTSLYRNQLKGDKFYYKWRTASSNFEVNRAQWSHAEDVLLSFSFFYTHHHLNCRLMDNPVLSFLPKTFGTSSFLKARELTLLVSVYQSLGVSSERANQFRFHSRPSLVALSASRGLAATPNRGKAARFLKGSPAESPRSQTVRRQSPFRLKRRQKGKGLFILFEKINYLTFINRILIRFFKVLVNTYSVSPDSLSRRFVLRLTPSDLLYRLNSLKYMYRGRTIKSGALHKGGRSASLSNPPFTSYTGAPLRLVAFANHAPLIESYYDPRFRWFKRTRRVRVRPFTKRLPQRGLLGTAPQLSLPTKAPSAEVWGDRLSALADAPNLNLFLKQPGFLLRFFLFSLQPNLLLNCERRWRFLLKSSSHMLAVTTFSSRANLFNLSNLSPRSVFKSFIFKKLLKLFKYYKFSTNIVMWYHTFLIRFVEFCTGRKAYLRFNPFLENSLTFLDLARCALWKNRLVAFQRILGPRIFINESLHIILMALKYKDPTFLSNWIRGMLKRMSFWKYRLLFRYLKYVLKFLFAPYFKELGFKGLKFRLKGKISVAGNARTRTLLYQLGETSYSKFSNKVVTDFSTLGTFTGVLGFRIWFFFTR